MPTNVAVHEISFRGRAGTIFMCMIVATVCYVIGFATPNWSSSGSYNEGLWEHCTCGEHGDKEGAFNVFIASGILCVLMNLQPKYRTF